MAPAVTRSERRRLRLLLVSPSQPAALYSLTSVADITGCPAYMPNIALATLAALTPRDIEIRIVDEVVEPIEPHFDGDWDAVGITGYVTHRARMFELADEFRRRGRRVLIGGPYATLSATTVRPHADVLFVGEAEETWPEFLEDLRAGRCRDEYRAKETVDLRASPIPALEYLRNDRYLVGVLQTSRGCPFECEFCDVIVYLGRKQRYKTPDQVVAEAARLHAAGYHNVLLADDNFTAYRSNSKGILAALAHWNRGLSEPLAFGTQLSIDAARDAELLDACAQAGLNQVFIGIETSSRDALLDVKKRQNVRGDLVDDIREFQKRAIAVQAGLITGFDTDTTDSFRQQFDFMQRAGVPAVLVNMLMAPEGTPLERRLRDENRLLGTRGEDGYSGTNLVPKRMTLEELHEGTRWLLNRLYAPEAFLERVAVLAAHTPPMASAPRSHPRDAEIWKNLLRAYADLGEDFRRVPREAIKAFRHRDTSPLGTAMIFHVHNVRVLQRQGMWDPTLGRRSDPEFRSPA